MLVLDSNEYLSALGANPKSSAVRLIKEIATSSHHQVRIPRLIAGEVRRHLSPEAFLAAYTEWVGADALITENRHFLTRHPDLPFRVLTAEAFLR